MNDSKKLINVIIPVYNMEKYLDRCLESVFNQIYKDLRILLVDDGSKDESLSICEKWSRKDQRIEVIHLEKNAGLANARNVGLEKVDFSTGFVAFVDSDDYIAPDYFETLYKMLVENDADFSWVGIRETESTALDLEADTTTDVRVVSSHSILLREDLRILYSVVYAKLYKAKLWEQIRFDTSFTYYEDGATTFKAIYNAENVAVTDKKLYYYFKSPNSLTRSLASEKRYIDGVRTADVKIDFYKEHGEKKLLDMAYVSYLNTLLVDIVSMTRESNMAGLRREFRQKYKAGLKEILHAEGLRAQKLKFSVCGIWPGFYRIWNLLKK